MSPETPFLLSGVLHLLPLPAAPHAGPGFRAVLDRALYDAEALVRGGIHSCVVENFGDAPFVATGVDPHVPAMMAVIGAALRQRFGDALSLGLNILRNDAIAAMGAAAACEAAFIRVNVLSGATWTDQGLITGEAHRLLRYRRELGAPVRIAADLLVKHGVPAGQTDLGELAREASGRGGADVLILTGSRTGAPASLDDVARVREAVPSLPAWVGSGVTPETVAAVARVAQGAIVGTTLHQEGRIGLPLDIERVRRLVGALGA